MNNIMSLGIIGITGFITYKFINNKSNDTNSYDNVSSGGGNPSLTPEVLDIVKNFTKPKLDTPNYYNMPNKTSNNQMNYHKINDNLTIATKNNNIVGGISFDRKQSLTKKGARAELAVVDNPIVKILRISSSHHSHSSNSKKSSSISKPKSKKEMRKSRVSKPLNIKKAFENKRRISTTLSTKQISAFHYLTGGF